MLKHSINGAYGELASIEKWFRVMGQKNLKNDIH